MDYTFAHAAPDEVKDIFMLYEKRVKWMNEHDIQQWNVTSQAASKLPGASLRYVPAGKSDSL